MHLHERLPAVAAALLLVLAASGPLLDIAWIVAAVLSARHGQKKAPFRTALESSE